MKTGKFTTFLILLFIISNTQNIYSFVNFRVTNLDNPAPGYIMCGPVNGSFITLYDNSGRVAYSKDMSAYGNNFTALRKIENGNFAFFSHSIQEWIILDDSLEVVDRVKVSPPYITDYHTIQVTPSGNYLLAGNQYLQVDMSKKVAGGYANADIVNIIIQELDVYKNVVFEWNTYQHIDVTEATRDVNLTGHMIDPYHINCVRYDTDGNLIANFRNLDQIVKINRSNGSIMWKMGGSASKGNQFIFYNDTREGFTGFSHQHDPKRLPNGNILIYDNGNLKPTPYSRAVEYSINEQTKTVTKVWEYRHSPDLWGVFTGNAQRLPNGNTLICWGSTDYPNETFATEVTPDGKTAIELSMGAYSGFYQTVRFVFKMDAVMLDIGSTGKYTFSDLKYNTGFTLDISSITGSGFVSVEKHGYPAWEQTFTNDKACVSIPKRWVINGRNISNIKAKLQISYSEFATYPNKQDLKIFYRKTEGTGNFQVLETTYNNNTGLLEANINGLGEYIIGYTYLINPILSTPANEAKHIATRTMLQWSNFSPDEIYRIQISRDPGFNDLVLDSANIPSNFVWTPFLNNFTKYYWRVKSSNKLCNSDWSVTNSFTTIIGTPFINSPPPNSTGQPLSGTLKWFDVRGAEQYMVHVSEDASFIKLVLDNDTLKSTSCNYYNFKPLTRYYWMVAAMNGKVSGYWSMPVSFVTFRGKVKLNSPDSSAESVPVNCNFRWDKINSVDYYRLVVSSDKNFNSIVLDTLVSKSTSFTCQNLNYFSSYYWKVKGIYKDTTTEWSNTWVFRTAPLQPKLVSPANNSINVQLDVPFYWELINGIKTYRFQVATDKDFLNVIYDKLQDTTGVRNVNLDYNSNLYWRVMGVEGNIKSDWSQVFTFSTLNQLISPPNNSFNLPLSVELIWYSKKNATNYEIFVSSNPAFKDTLFLITDIKDTSFLLNNLKYNSEYYWKVKTYRQFATTTWSNVHKFSTILESPKPVYPYDSEIITESMIKFRWTAVSGARYFRLQLAYDSDFSNIAQDFSDLSSNDLDFDNLMIDMVYYWRVMAYNANNSSEWSTISRFLTTYSTFTVISPREKEIWVKDWNKKLISWSTLVNQPVRIELYSSGKFHSVISDSVYNADGKHFWVIPENVPNGNSYQIKVETLKLPKVSSYSKFFSIMDEGIVSVEKDNTFSQQMVTNFPNPFSKSTEFSFLIKNQGSLILKIINSAGVVVFYKKFENVPPGTFRYNWVPEDLPAGAYLYTVLNDNFTQTGITIYNP